MKNLSLLSFLVACATSQAPSPPSTPASPEALQAAAEREVQFLTEEREAARALVLALDVESADVLGHA
ncbi:MAG: hypothetical protein AAGE52_18950, partial [Myxococcota bacterium]